LTDGPPPDPRRPLADLPYRYDDPFAPVICDAPEIVRIDGNQITDEQSFHTVFAAAMGFPDFYGANLNAWVDCMSDLRSESRMTRFRLIGNQILHIELRNSEEFALRLPTLFAGFIGSAAAVNQRAVARDEDPVLALVLL
jgi:hypothetical protein